MADRKKFFIHRQTGEVIERRTLWGACRYFKRDGKKLGYDGSRKNVVLLRDFIFEKVMGNLNAVVEEEPDGIA